MNLYKSTFEIIKRTQEIEARIARLKAITGKPVTIPQAVINELKEKSRTTPYSFHELFMEHLSVLESNASAGISNLNF